MRILLVEDDNLLGEGVVAGLRRENHSVDWVNNGTAVASAVADSVYDVIVLDLGLPDISGLQVLERLRSEGYEQPVLILTALDDTESRVRGLDAGADDYMVKPIELAELYARLRALSRRAHGRTENILRYRDIELDPGSHTVKRGGVPVELSRREFSLLQELMQSSGRVLSRAQLEEKLYGWRDEVGSNAVEVHIHHLRKRFGSDLIRTIRGIGYSIPRED